MSGGAIVLEEEVGRFDGAKVGMLIFLGAETMLFAGFVTAYLVFRLGAPVWPPPLQPRLPVGVTARSARVGWLFFGGAETMLSPGFVPASLVFRRGAPVWPPPLQPRLPVGVTA